MILVVDRFGFGVLRFAFFVMDGCSDWSSLDRLQGTDGQTSSLERKEEIIRNFDFSEANYFDPSQNITVNLHAHNMTIMVHGRKKKGTVSPLVFVRTKCFASVFSRKLQIDTLCTRICIVESQAMETHAQKLHKITFCMSAGIDV